ncbi:MAG: ribosome-associated translation inhibitor RaiA [Alloprevotella sp.]|nr:ribosome-associated translation inhibitor RaiA [Alloprevotella sp.]MBR6339344.1 ribosome-associated translation inhibitor RaiA [Alloprevotella sp.]
MELNINAVHFSATDRLQEFIEKKLAKIAKNNEDILDAEVTLKVVKPETAMNKEAAISLHMRGADLRASKVADTFEAAVDLCIDSIKPQIEKAKAAKR